jgi:hypothetical protein
MRTRTPLFRMSVVFLALLLTVVLATAAAADGKGDFSGNAVGFTPITGSPLTINVAVDGSYQVIHDAVDPLTPGQVYPTSYDEADAGIFVWYGDYVIGPDFDNHDISASNSYDPWTNVSQTAVTGTGTEGDPFVITTDVINNDSGVTASIDTSYVDGLDYFRITWEVCVPTPGDISTFLAADFYLEGSDDGYGYYDAATGSVGGYNETQDWYQIFTPVNPADAYMESNYWMIWDVIGSAGAAGTGFDNTILNTLVDNGGGLQWNESAVSGCVSFGSWWSFGTTPITPPTSVDVSSLSGQTSAGMLPLLVAVAVVFGLAGALVLRRRFVN